MRRACVVVAGIMATASTASAEEILVSTRDGFIDAFSRARAGDVVRVMPGTYRFSSSIWTSNPGTPTAPILVTGGTVPEVRLDFESVEGLVFNHAHWILENVWVNGDCGDPADCEAAVGVKPPADGFVMRGCRISNWSQHVKASRSPDDEADDASLLANEFYNDVRINGSVVDIVGGKRWRVAGNFVHDFGGDPSAGDYGIFLKGATSDGVVERNLVICGHLRPSFGIEVGISMGGGGTGNEYCPNRDCSCEDFNSVVRNNIVLNCSDVGLHTKRACGSKFYHNVVARSDGGLQIQENGAGDPVVVQNNVLEGSIFGGDNHSAMNNVEGASGALLSRIYRDPANADFREGSDPSVARDLAVRLPEVSEDYCGAPRPDTGRDLGPVEFPAACETFPWSGVVPPPPRDGGVGADAGGAGGADAGLGPGPGGQDGPRLQGDPAEGGCACRSTRAEVAALGWGVVLLAGWAGRRRGRASRGANRAEPPR